MQERIAALLFFAASGAYLALSLPLPRGVAARPGPGFFPLLVGVFLCLVALGFVVTTFRRPPTRTAGAAAGLAAAARPRVVATAVCLVGFCALLPWTGFVVITFVFVAVLLKRLGSGWTAALVVGVLSAAGAYYLFAVLLSVPLPRGVWFD